MAELQAFAQSVFETGRGWTDELTCYTKDGRTLPAEISASSANIGGRLHMIAMVRDLTERRRAQEALRQYEARSTALLESASEGILVADGEGHIVIVNARIEALFGYGRDELLGRPVEMLIPENLRGIHAAHRQGFFSYPRRRLMGSGLGLFGRRKDGSQFPADISLNFVETEEGILAIVFIVDLTERQEAEEALRRSEATNRAFVRAIPDLMYRVRGDGTLLDSNATEREDLLYAPEWSLAKTLSETLTPEGAQRTMQCIELALQTGEMQILEHQVPVRGEMRHRETRFVANGPDEVLFIVRDVTERKRAEEALSRLADDTAVVADIGRIISSSLDIGEVYERFCQEVGKLLTFDRIAVNLVDLESDTISITYVMGTDIPERRRGRTIPLAGSLAEEAVRTKSVHLVQSQSEAEIARGFPSPLPNYLAGLASFLTVPLVSNGEVVGVLTFQSATHGAYAEADVALAEGVGAQIAGTIANARLYAERLLAEEEVRKLSRAVEQVSVAVALTDAEGRFEYVNPTFSRITGYTLEQVKGKNPSILKSGRTSQDEYRRLWETIVSGGEWQGEFHNQRKDGVLFWVSASISPIKDTKGVITHFIAVEEDITERKLAEEALSRLVDETALVAEIGRIISSSLDIDQVYGRFCREVSKLIAFDRIAINLVDLENQTISITYVMGTDIPEKRRGQVIPMAGTLVEVATRTKSAQLVQPQSEAEMAQRFPSLLPNYRDGFVSFLTVPLVSNGEVVAVMNLHSRKPGTYSDRDVALAEKVGAQIAGTIANARLYADRLLAEDRIKASLSEKEVLLQEINHRVKNNLQIISSLLNLQSRDIRDERAREIFNVSQDRIKAMALVHEKLYQSEDLARIDFGEYLRSLTDDLRNSYGLRAQGIDLKIDVDRIFLGVDEAIPCGLIVNELVSNALKHAFPDGATGKIGVSVHAVDNQYVMVVRDNGVGLPEDLDIRHMETLGMTVVNALAGQLGGAVDLTSSDGLEVRITFPAE